MFVDHKAYDDNINPKLILIESNYLELLRDDDPMLYVGTSYYRNRIIGSIIEDNSEEKVLRYFHAIVSDILYKEFLGGTKSLRNVFQESEIVYIVDFNYDSSLKGIFSLRYTSIPEGWLPLENSFCPDFILPVTLNYSTSLKGGIADNNEARPNDAIIFYDFTWSALHNALNTLSKLNYDIEPYYEPAKTGSYKLDFKLVVKRNVQSDLVENDIDEGVLANFLSKYLDVAFNKLPKDLVHSKIEETEVYEELVSTLKSVYENNYAVIDRDIEKSLKKSMVNVIKSSEKLTNAFGEGFTLVEFNGYDAENNAYPIATIEKNYFDKVCKFLPPIEEDDDERVRDFEIKVYDINSDTLKCKAYVIYTDDEGGDRMEKASIKHGLNSLDHTIYSKSLDQKIRIPVKGKGKYKNGKITELEITED